MNSAAFSHNDGGRQAAGYRGTARDCVCRALAIVTGQSYADVYREINRFLAEQCDGQGGCSRTGIAKPYTRRVIAHFGGIWQPTMRIGQGCTVHLRPDELLSGRLIVNLTGHVAAVIGGVLHDTHDSSRGGTRCVYGYWRFE